MEACSKASNHIFFVRGLSFTETLACLWKKKSALVFYCLTNDHMLSGLKLTYLLVFS